MLEEISRKAYSIKKRYAEILLPLLEDLPSILPLQGFVHNPRALPPPPKRPLFVRRTLAAYAIELFDNESAVYPQTEAMRPWIQKLARRIERDVLGHAISITAKSSKAFNFTEGLSYHASRKEMTAAVRDALKLRIDAFKPSSAVSAMEPTTTATAATKGKARSDFIMPILEKKGLTRSGWAARAGVHPDVVYGYLDGTSTPRPENRNALAGALDISESKLPD